VPEALKYAQFVKNFMKIGLAYPEIIGLKRIIKKKLTQAEHIARYKHACEITKTVEVANRYLHKQCMYYM